MSASLRPPPRMTRDEFLDWAAAQEGRWEFDGFEPVTMTGGLRGHDQICQNIWFALRSRLRGGPSEVLGPNAGVATVGDAVRYPDALVTCTRGRFGDRLIAGVVVVFEVLSRGTRRTDRVVKLNEYQSVPSIRRYVLVETEEAGLMVMERGEGTGPFTASGLTEADVLRMPEVGIEVPVAEFYEGVAFDDGAEATA